MSDQPSLFSASANDLGDESPCSLMEHAVGTLGPADGVGRYRQTDHLQGLAVRQTRQINVWNSLQCLRPCGP